MTEQQGISNMGIDIGLLYMTEADGSNIVSFSNTRQGVRNMRKEANSVIPFGNGVASHASIVFGTVTGPGNITDISLGVTNQIGANIDFNGLTAAQVAALVETAINGFDPGTNNWTAVAVEDTVHLHAPLSRGSDPDGETPIVTISGGTLGTTITSFSGGFAVGEDTTGLRFYIDSREEAVGNVIAPQAVEITGRFVIKSSASGINIIDATLVDDGLSVDRTAQTIHVFVDGEGSVADDFDQINTVDFADGDVVVFSRKASGPTITVKETASGNLKLAGAAEYSIDDDDKVIEFRYDGSTSTWREKSRPGLVTVTDAILLTGGVSRGISGTKIFTIPAGGGSDEVIADTDAMYIVLKGAGVTLAAGYSFNFSTAAEPRDGIAFYVHYTPVGDVNGNTVTIFGITLTTVQAEGGAFIIGFYDTVSNAVQAKVLVDAATAFAEVDKMTLNTITTDRLVLQGAVAAGSFIFCNLTVDAQGIITAISNGAGALTGVTNLTMAGDLFNYEAVNDANPSFFIGSGTAERLQIRAFYDAGAQTLDYVLFKTFANSAAADKGEYRFYVDEASILQINDDGIDMTTGKAYYVNGTQVLGVQASAIADLVWTYTANDPATVADSVVTFADGSALAAATLYEALDEIEAKMNAMLAMMRSHGIIAT